jgi:hypothetical protein
MPPVEWPGFQTFSVRPSESYDPVVTLLFASVTVTGRPRPTASVVVVCWPSGLVTVVCVVKPLVSV